MISVRFLAPAMRNIFLEGASFLGFGSRLRNPQTKAIGRITRRARTPEHALNRLNIF